MSRTQEEPPVNHADQVGSRRKKWHLKVRTGCGTCKRRRLKCDEAKPTCRRCFSASLACDGYASVPKPKLFVSSKEQTSLSSDSDSASTDSVTVASTIQHQANLQVSKACSIDHAQDTVLSFMPSSPYKDIHEQTALKYWLAISEGEGYQNPANVLVNLFGTHMPQAAWSNAAVRHGLIAAASIMSAHDNHFSTSNRDATRALSVSANHQQQAIASLLRGGQSPQVFVLTALILWVAEVWSGRAATAGVHVLAAIKISQEAQAAAIAKGDETDDETFNLFKAVIENIPDIPRFDTMVSEAVEMLELNDVEAADLRQYFAVQTLARAQAWMKQMVKTISISDQVRIDSMAKEALTNLLSRHAQLIQKVLQRWSWIPPESEKARFASKVVEQHIKSGEYTYTPTEKMVEDFSAGKPSLSVAAIEVRLVMTLRTILLYAAQTNTALFEDAAFASHRPMEH